ncbi:hypothetical protein NP493_6586g00004 [Ridgeia piscesae]|uniref:Uncharacterized protein n=1 Tax=Ridgeia piscesae TaxID=27915 RepID=A0AAD9IS25_RIDPI|nr:hypothetical protein NP493_6586g00004 [Ridgeia piscesae]
MAALSARVCPCLSLCRLDPGYPHDRTQMSRLHIDGWTARLHGISCL